MKTQRSLIQAGVSVSLTALSAWLDDLFLPVLILLAAMVADYLSGMAKAWVTKTLSSKTGLRGIVKKLCYLLAVGAGLGTDFLLSYAATASGKEYAFSCPVACLVAIWLILNEVISILENVSDIGIPLPSFLLTLTERLREQTDKIEL